jgi:hypothetical protein
MVWNITKDDIRVRMAIVDEDVWPPTGWTTAKSNLLIHSWL